MTEKQLARLPIAKKELTFVRPVARTAEDVMPEIRSLLGPDRTNRTIRAAFVIRLRRHPVGAEMMHLQSFSAGVSVERLLAEIDAMGEMPIATLADEQIRIPGE